MPDWRQLVSLINLGMAYYTTQLVRCAAFSFVLIGLVMLLRKILFSERTFLRGMSWAVFLVIPFLGRLKIFYENEAVLKATWRITAVTASWLWVDCIYMAGILITVICIFGKRLRLWRTVAGMEKVMFENVRIYVTDMNITSFTVGLLKPKIVLPKVMADSYSKDELKSVIRHEQMHIRSGHLWFGFAWDILRCLLWINPLLTVFQKHFRADMEEGNHSGSKSGDIVNESTVSFGGCGGGLVIFADDLGLVGNLRFQQNGISIYTNIRKNRIMENRPLFCLLKWFSNLFLQCFLVLIDVGNRGYNYTARREDMQQTADKEGD